MAIVKLAPAFKDYLWGGTKLKESYGKKTDLDIVAESWELSTHPDGESVVTTGPYAGMKLSEYVNALGKDCLGTKGNAFEFFPILIKFIDANNHYLFRFIRIMSMHYVLKKNTEKQKCGTYWIVKKALLFILGVKQRSDKRRVCSSHSRWNLLEILKKVPVHKGDVSSSKLVRSMRLGQVSRFVKFNRIQIQHIRVFDYGRVGKDGKPRELHIEKAIDVSNLSPIESDFKPCGPQTTNGDAKTVMLATCDLFTTYETTLNGSTTLNVDKESFGSIVVLEGAGTIENNGETLTFAKGDSIFIAANSGEVKITGNCQWIYSRV